jgi:RHS repeat-associated protein
MNSNLQGWKTIVGSVLLGLLAAGSASSHVEMSASGPGSSSSSSQADTSPIPIGIERRLRLADDRQLRLSAEGTRLTLWDVSEKRAVRTHTLPVARHQATLTALPSGRVLLWGGTDGRGEVQRGGLWFDPELKTLEPTQNLTLSSRAGHTATVLTDGRVLFAGGQGTAQGAELWDEQSNEVIALDTGSTRLAGHRAELQADGRLRLSGAAGKTPADRGALLFDPATLTFIASKVPAPVSAQAGLAGSLPVQSAQAVSPDARLSVRFTEPMRMADLQASNVMLLGPGGAAAVKVIAVEDGRLVFVQPTRALFPNSQYTLLIDDVHTRAGKAIPLITIDFKTAALPVDAMDPQQPATSSTNTPIEATSPWSLPALKGCGQGIGPAAPCRPTATLKDGIWTPGRSNTQSRWRIAEPQPELMQTALMSRVTEAVGFTTLIGQIRRVDGVPVANVEISVGKMTARTNRAGHFTLYNAPAGRQEVYVDGSTANGDGIEYGQFVIGVDIAAGKLTQLPYTMYLPRITERDKLRIPSPTTRDTVLTHPDMPGLMVEIPAGTVIRDRKGRIVRELAIVPTPVNRAPFPVAENYPMYFTLEPGGAVIQGLTPEAAKGVRIFYPNYDGHPKGTQANFWIYDPAEGWRVYGKGRVTSNGKVFAPEAGVALHQTMGGSYSIDSSDDASEEDMPPDCQQCGEGNAGSGGNATAGDPIDLRTGSFSYAENDIAINDVMPITLGRNYRQNDLRRRDFGYGTASNYSYRLYAVPDTSTGVVKLILPNGSPLYFNRVSGSGYNSVWEHNGTTAMSGATMTLVAGTAFRVTMRDGSMLQFGKLSPNPLHWIQDRYGNRIEFVRDAGLVTRIISPSGRYLDLEYDDDNRIESAKDALGNTWSYHYNGDGMLSQITYPDLTHKNYSYDMWPTATMGSAASKQPSTGSAPRTAGIVAQSTLAEVSLKFHRVSEIHDRRGHRVLKNERGTNINDGNFGRIVKQILADGDTYEINYRHYDGTTTGVLVKQPDDTYRRVVFDPNSKYPISDTLAYGSPLEQVYTFERDGYGRMTARIDPLLRRTEYGYNGIGQITSVTYLADTPEAVSVSMGYNADHQLTSITDPLNRTTTLEYENGCLVGVINPLQKRISLTCNLAGQPTSVTDPLSRTTYLHYLDYDLSEIVDPMGRYVRFRHDALGRVIAVEDAEGNLSRREYDAEGRVWKLISPDEEVTELEHDPNGNVTAVLMPHGNGITYTYDERDRVETRTDSLSQAEGWTYTHMNRVESYTDRKQQTTTFDYDDLGRLETTTYHDGSTVTATYDDGDRLLSLVDTVSGTLGWDYDDLDRVIETVTAQGSVGYEYDDAGRREAMTPAGQPRIEYEYDDADRLQRILQGSEVVEFDYDDADRLIETVLPNGIQTGYAYNDSNQVTGIAWLKPDSTLLGDLGYGYNDVGRRTAQTGSFASNTLPAASTGNDFDDNNRQTVHNGQILSYDNNGNLTGDGTRTYVWNARDQLVAIKQGTTTIASFGYDAMGRRYAKTEGGQTTSYLYDGLDPVQEAQGSTINPILTGLGIDQRYARNDQGGRTYFLTDALGSTRALTNASGNVVQRYDYTPYGETTQTSTNFSNPYQYTGRERDASGMYYYRARYYSAGMGRFVSEDSYGFAAGDANFYAYGLGDPISNNDPTGHIVPAIIGIWALIELGLSIYDAYDTGKTLLNPCASGGQKAAAAGLFLAGMVLPGGGYSHLHHAWPKYLGGAVKQDLVQLPEALHKAYHSGLDKILPRQSTKTYYDNLVGAARQQMYRDLADYTKAFDAAHGTQLYDAMLRNGFPGP